MNMPSELNTSEGLNFGQTSGDDLKLSFDPNTIQHLGVSLYSQLPSVLSELVSNSWDADADHVSINFIEEGLSKKIIYNDDGYGMTYQEMNNKYLVIGRNKRKESDKSPKGRKPIGKKGLGKLSVFGICDKVTITSIKDGLENSFTMVLDDILKSETGEYSPIINIKDNPTELKSKTEIVLEGIRRKSAFDINDVATSLSKKFIIFDQIAVKLITGEEEDESLDNTVCINNELKFESLEKQFEWLFPETSLTNSNYKNKCEVEGRIITATTPVKSPDMRGIYLTSRGKIVNIAEFYGARDNDQFHSYVTGYLSVDFIDEESIDLISTDRHSLNWENDETRELKLYLQEIIKKIGSEWREKRSEIKIKHLKEDSGIDVEKFYESLGAHEKILGKEILTPILSTPQIDVQVAEDLTKKVIEKFQNQDFKEYAHSITQLDITDESKAKLIGMLNDWKVIEAKQYASLAETRISVIQQFEQYLDDDTKEVPTLHNFLRDFPWLIDPRILEFRDEVRYSAILKENFPDEELEETDRRIDFLCSNALGNVLYVVEIKRSKFAIDSEALEQAWDYQSFLKDKYASESGFSQVISFVIGGVKKTDRKTRSKEDSYRKSGEVFAKTYQELLEQSKYFHKEFLEKYKDLNN